MNCTEQLKKKLDTTLHVLLELEFMKQSIEKISDKDSKYFEGSSNNSQFLNTVYKTFVRMFVVDLYKLIDKKSHFYLPKTINFCKNNLSQINWKHEITLEDLERIEKKFTISESVYTEIKTLRDKFYAHTDSNRFNYEISIKPDDLWEILKNLQEIFRLICQDFNNNCWLFEIQFKGVPELRYVSNYKMLQKLIINCNKNKIENIETDKLFKIIMN